MGFLRGLADAVDGLAEGSAHVGACGGAVFGEGDVDDVAGDAGLSGLCCGDLPAFVDILPRQAHLSGGETVLIWNSFRSTFSRHLPPSLGRIVLISQPTLCPELDLQRIGLGAVDGAGGRLAAHERVVLALVVDVATEANLDTPTIKLLRFADLKEAQVVSSWPQLRRLIDKHGFPPGYLISPAVRVWDVAVVDAWLQERRDAADRKTAGAGQVAA